MIRGIIESMSNKRPHQLEQFAGEILAGDKDSMH